MFKELYPSDLKQLSFEKSYQWLPFSTSTTQGIKVISQEIVKMADHTSIYAWYDKGKVVYLFHVTHLSRETLIVHQVICLTTEYTFEACQRGLVRLGKTYRFDQLVLALDKQATAIDSWLKQQGYDFVEGQGYVLSLNYHTGLVLGGGGAKGSYQIGVWHALDELGIKYQMISGTSVGALNGGLILQGEREVAEKMWENITTDQILSVSQGENSDYSVSHLIDSWQELATTAVQSKGVSTEPLLHLIRELVKPEIIFSKELPFYIVTTKTPMMEETVVSLKEMTEETLPYWLLASSSFFPAMEPCLIDGVYYVDGGYKNNVPKDVLIEKGATELIIIDVSGPGFSKTTKVPKEVVESTLKSPWSLGSVLLFDGNRASWNMSLGYLEAMKLFGHFKGIEYTFDKQDFKQRIFGLSRDFIHFISQIDVFESWYQKKTSLKKWDWLISHKQTPEMISLLIMEDLAKKFKINPAQLYDIDELLDLILLKTNQEEQTELLNQPEQMLKSVGEWLTRYLKEKTPINEYQLLLYFYRYLKDDKLKNREMYQVLMDLSWRTGLEALFLLFLEERK